MGWPCCERPKKENQSRAQIKATGNQSLQYDSMTCNANPGEPVETDTLRYNSCAIESNQKWNSKRELDACASGIFAMTSNDIDGCSEVALSQCVMPSQLWNCGQLNRERKQLSRILSATMRGRAKPETFTALLGSRMNPTKSYTNIFVELSVCVSTKRTKISPPTPTNVNKPTFQTNRPKTRTR